MARLDPLLEDYLEAHAEDAAADLARQLPREVLAFWSDLAPVLAARVFEHFPPALQEFVAEHATDDRLAECIDAGETEQGLRLVAALAAERRDAVLGRIDGGRRRRLSRLTRQPAGTVGSLLSTRLIRLSAELPVDEAVTQVREARTAAPLCILDDEGRLRGVLDPVRLLAAEDPRKPVSSLVDPVTPLPAATQLELAADDPQWNDHRWLPVCDRKGRLLGVLHRDRVREHARGAGDPRAPLVLSPLIASYVGAMSQLATALFGARRR